MPAPLEDGLPGSGRLDQVARTRLGNRVLPRRLRIVVRILRRHFPVVDRFPGLECGDKGGSPLASIFSSSRQITSRFRSRRSLMAGGPGLMRTAWSRFRRMLVRHGLLLDRPASGRRPAWAIARRTRSPGSPANDPIHPAPGLPRRPVLVEAVEQDSRRGIGRAHPDRDPLRINVAMARPQLARSSAPGWISGGPPAAGTGFPRRPSDRDDRPAAHRLGSPSKPVDEGIATRHEPRSSGPRRDEAVIRHRSSMPEQEFLGVDQHPAQVFDGGRGGPCRTSGAWRRRQARRRWARGRGRPGRALG